MKLHPFVKFGRLAALATAVAIGVTAASAGAAARSVEVVAAPGPVAPAPELGLAVEERVVGIVTWCHGALQCLVVADLCAGIFVYDEVDGAGDPTHGYCDDGVGSSDAAPAPSRGPGPVLGARCPEGTFLSPFEKPIYDDEGLFVVGYETVWYCLPDDLGPEG